MNQVKDFNAESFVEENKYSIPSDHSKIGLQLRCIDDRASNSLDRSRDIAIPGAGLGLVMDVLGAFTLLRRNGKHATLTPEEAIGAVERALCAVYFHTDEKSVKNKGVACGGCGHCNSALIDPVKYLISENDAKYFFEHGLSDIKERLKKWGVKPTVYTGSHNAHAVIVIESDNFGLPSVGKSGEQVYVYHKKFHELLLELIANELTSLLSSHSQGVSEKEFVDALHESARARLSVTLDKLASELPKFLVTNEQSISVQPMK